MPGVDLHLSNFVLVSPPSGIVSKLKTGKDDITLSIIHTHTNVEYKLLKLSVVKIHLTTDMNVTVLGLDPVF